MKITVEHRNDTVPYHVYEAVQIFFAVKPDIEFVPYQDETVIKIDSPAALLHVIESDNNIAKRDIYAFLSKHLGYTSPWGAMTGIRPAKIVNSLRSQNLTDEEIVEHIKDFYLTREDKVRLALETANAQDRFLEEQKNNKNYIGFYSGIPFCPTRCLYCSFTSNPISRYKKIVDLYLDIIEEEIKGTAGLIKENGLIIRTLYLGGGTPTSLNEEQFERYLSILCSNLNLSNIDEFSLEAGRPDSITEGKLKSALGYGVNRISINPQTMNDSTLQLIGRRHTSEETINAFNLARKMGFDNINMDIIAGLPNENIEMFSYTLEQLKILKPDSITVHTLSIKRAANLKADTEAREMLDPALVEEMLFNASKLASDLDMHPYYMYRQKNMLGNHENVAYCRKNCESPYNIHIMEEDQTILAVGAGAVSKRVYDNQRIERAFNMKSVEDYISRKEEAVSRKKVLLS